MIDTLARWLQPANLLVMPVLAKQGKQLRASMPRLPEAEGAAGTVGQGGEPFELLVFGDSLAAGVGVAHNEDALTGHLAASLASATGRPVSWRVVARAGATASSLARKDLGRLADVATRCPPDLVVVLVGMNDLMRYRDLRRWRHDVRVLLRDVRAEVGDQAAIMAAGIPPVGQFPTLPQPFRAVFGRRAKVMDGILADVCASLDATHVRLHLEKIASGSTFFASDRFHPSADGYRQLAERLALVWRGDDCPPPGLP